MPVWDFRNKSIFVFFFFRLVRISYKLPRDWTNHDLKVCTIQIHSVRTVEQILNTVFRPDYFHLPQQDTECPACIPVLYKQKCLIVHEYTEQLE